MDVEQWIRDKRRELYHLGSKPDFIVLTPDELVDLSNHAWLTNDRMGTDAYIHGEHLMFRGIPVVAYEDVK